jgi:hypothetical protein
VVPPGEEAGPPGEEAGAEEVVPPAERTPEQRRLEQKKPEQRRPALQERRTGRVPLPAVPRLEKLPCHPLPLCRCPELPPATPLLRSSSKGSDRRREAVLLLQRALPASASPFFSSLQQEIPGEKYSIVSDHSVMLATTNKQ